jgi:hypothetical protein
MGLDWGKKSQREAKVKKKIEKKKKNGKKAKWVRT